jgi:hypothetical protein
MKQYRVTYKVDTGDGDDCVLDSNDPLNKIKEEMFLGKVPGIDVYEIYPEEDGHDTPKNPYSDV